PTAASSSIPLPTQTPSGGRTGTSSTASDPTPAATTSRQVGTGTLIRPLRSPGDRDGGEDAVEDPVGGHALQLDLRPQLDPVAQGRLGHGLDLVGGDVLLAGQPGPGLGGVQQHGRCPGGGAGL